MDDKQPAVKTAGYPYQMPTAFFSFGHLYLMPTAFTHIWLPLSNVDGIPIICDTPLNTNRGR